MSLGPQRQREYVSSLHLLTYGHLHSMRMVRVFVLKTSIRKNASRPKIRGWCRFRCMAMLVLRSWASGYGFVFHHCVDPTAGSCAVNTTARWTTNPYPDGYRIQHHQTVTLPACVHGTSSSSDGLKCDGMNDDGPHWGTYIFVRKTPQNTRCVGQQLGQATINLEKFINRIRQHPRLFHRHKPFPPCPSVHCTLQPYKFPELASLSNPLHSHFPSPIPILGNTRVSFRN